MDWLSASFLVSIFLFSSTVFVLIYLFWNEGKFTEKLTVKKRLMYISAGGQHGKERLVPYREEVLKDVGFLERMAFRLPRIAALDRKLVKTRVPFNASMFIISSISLGVMGSLLGFKLLPQPLAGAVLGVAFMVMPYFYLELAERHYYAKFNEQLPEALDLLSRAMRSGHALTSGLEMIAQEMEAPIKTEFSVLIDEINLGLTLKDAFSNLCERVPSTDLRFLAIAVVIQKETGGNLAEILDNISRLIRERIQFARQVKSLTAEGKLSAFVLIILPIFMFIYIYMANYNYISILWTDRTGYFLLISGIILQITGSYVINRIVKIEI